MKNIFPLISILFLFSCEWLFNPSGGGQKVAYTFGDTVWIGYQDVLVAEPNAFRLRFDKLISDHRCPLDMECFWEGNAEVQFHLQTDTTSADIKLDTYWGWQQDTSLNGYYIALLGLLPRPHTDSSYTAADYRARVVVFDQHLDCLGKEAE